MAKMKKRRKFLKPILLILGLATLAVLAGLYWPMPKIHTPQPTDTLLIKSINIVDVVSGEILKNRDVFIKGNTIHSIDSAAGPLANSAQLVVNGKGKYLIPGLWDMHTHSTQYSPWLHHPLYIANGVTAVRDMSGQMGRKDSYWAGTIDRKLWNQKLSSHKQIAPRYVLQSSFQINGANSVPSGFPKFFKAESEEDVEELLQHYSKEGTDFIKVYSEIPADGYRHLTRKVDDYNMHIAGHKPLGLTLEEAILMGQRSFEHGRIFMYDCFPGEAELRNSENIYASYKKAKPSIVSEFDFYKAERLMKTMAKQNSYWTPTLQTLKVSAFADDEKYTNNPWLSYIPKMQKALWWNPDVGKAAKYNQSEEGSGINRKLYELAKTNVGMAQRHGVPIMAGTDVTDSYSFPGFSLHIELQELTSCGLTPLEALKSATLIPALYSSLSDSSGSVEAGKVADLVILAKNPLEDIRNTQTIEGVVLNGNYLNENQLSAYKKTTSELASSFHINVKYLFSLLGSPLMRRQLMD